MDQVNFFKGCHNIFCKCSNIYLLNKNYILSRRSCRGKHLSCYPCDFFKGRLYHIWFYEKIYQSQSSVLTRHLQQLPLREKCPNTELFVVRIFLYSDWIWRFTEWIVDIFQVVSHCKLTLTWLYSVKYTKSSHERYNNDVNDAILLSLILKLTKIHISLYRLYQKEKAAYLTFNFLKLDIWLFQNSFMH